MFTKNLDCLLITLGQRGCYYKTKSTSGFVTTIPLQAVDTTGAGDAFNAGYISALYTLNKLFSDMSKTELQKALYRANIIGSLTTLKKGAITAFPDKKALQKYA